MAKIQGPFDQVVAGENAIASESHPPVVSGGGTVTGIRRPSV